MSLDLMGDPDIQQVFHKSYSLEDLTLVSEEEDSDGVEAAIEATPEEKVVSLQAHKITVFNCYQKCQRLFQNLNKDCL